MKKGFTLVELLAVIVILTVILVITIPSITKIMDSVENAAYKNNVDMLVHASKLYLATDMPTNIGEQKTVQLADLIASKYISEIKDNKTGNLCNGVVEVQKTSANNYKFTPYLECGSQYNPQHYNGSIITINNPMGESLQNLKLYGQSNQNGVPTISSPIVITNSGDGGSIKIISAGKNLLNREEAYNIAYNFSPSNVSLTTKDGRNCIKASSLHTPNTPFSIKYKPNTQYTIGWESFFEFDPLRIGVGLYVQYTDGTNDWVMMNGAAKNAWYKDVATTAAGKTVDKIYWTYNGSTITYINYDSMFIYEGNVLPSTYEPYKGSEYTITLSEPLRSLSDGTKDYVDFNRGKVVRNVGRIITDGSSDENWIVDGTMGTVRYFCLSSLGSNLPVANLLSNRFKYNVKSYQEEITFSGGKYIEVGVLVSRLAADDLASFKLWLAANPVEILYKLKTPVEQDIVVPSIMATRGINTVYTTDVNQPPMEFDVDIKK